MRHVVFILLSLLSGCARSVAPQGSGDSTPALDTASPDAFPPCDLRGFAVQQPDGVRWQACVLVCAVYTGTVTTGGLLHTFRTANDITTGSAGWSRDHSVLSATPVAIGGLCGPVNSPWTLHAWIDAANRFPSGCQAPGLANCEPTPSDPQVTAQVPVTLGSSQVITVVIRDP